jgi:hypothetical protein
MQNSLAKYELPASMSKAIGRIITRWSYLEHCLQNIVWELCNLDAKQGRIAVREPRADERVAMIEDLAFLRGIPLQPKTMKGLKEHLAEAKFFRDTLAHSGWFYSEKDQSWAAQVTKGTWPKPNLPKGQQPISQELKKRLKPGALLLDTSSLLHQIQVYDILIDSAHALHVHVRARLQAQRQSSQETPPEQ